VVRGRSAERNATKYERAGVISDVLLVLLTLLADHLDGFELLEGLLRDSNLWKDGIQRHRIAVLQRFVPGFAGLGAEFVPSASLQERAETRLGRTAAEVTSFFTPFFALFVRQGIMK